MMQNISQHKTVWLDKIFQNSHIGILVVDKQHKILLVNAAMYHMFGYEENELIGQSASIFHRDEDAHREFVDLAFKLVLDGNPVSLDYEFKRKDGSYFWMRISGDIIQNGDEVLWTSIDVTQQVEAKQEVTVLNERLEFAIDGNRDIIWDWDFVKDSLFVSEKWRNILGYSQEIPTPKSVTGWVPYLYKSDFIKLTKLIKKTIRAKKEYIDCTYRAKHQDGHVLWLRMRGHIQYLGKLAIRMTGTHSDISQETSLQFKNKQQSQIIAQIHDSVIATDLDGFITSWNYGSELLLGYKEQEILGKHITMLYREEDYESLSENITILKQKGSLDAEVYLVKKSSELMIAELSLSLLKNEENQVVGLIGYSKDITQRKQTEEKLQESLDNLNKYLEVIDKIEIGLFVVDPDYTVRYMNNTMKRWFGDQTKKICYASVAGLEDPCPYCKLDDVIVEGEKVEYYPTTPDGRSFEIVATSVKNTDGTLSKMEVIRDITEQKAANDFLVRQKEELAYQAHHDSLTSLPNRLLFSSELERRIANAKRSGTKMALLFIDLDHFKEINDSLGHEIGDKVLGIVTHRLKETIRKGDMVARLGGDEFTILMEELIHGHDASILAKKILEVIVEPIYIDKNVLYVSSSIGISLYPDDGISTQNLLKYADAAMYKAKEEGRNNFQFYSSEMTELAFERVMMEASLREAIKNEDFVVYYQPQVDAKAMKITGFEALVRWKHSTMGMIPPSRFIPLAETTGLIVELDRFVMKTAITQLQEWYKEGLNPGKISLNLTVKQMQQADFMDFLKDVIAKTKADANLLELEIVEGQIMNDPEEAIALLNRLGSLGIKLAVDDFGTGYSSLAYLKKLPIDKLKIDQSFVRELPHDEEDAAISRAVIALATSLNLKIIAEGVETVAQKDFLVENGCVNIQGFLYSRPIPAEEITQILKDQEAFFAKIRVNDG